MFNLFLYTGILSTGPLLNEAKIFANFITDVHPYDERGRSIYVVAAKKTFLQRLTILRKFHDTQMYHQRCKRRFS